MRVPGMSLEVLIIGSDAGPFSDPDGFTWEPPTALSRAA